MWEEQESISKLKPLYLLMPNNQKIEVLIFFTNSEKNFWIKERENDWEEVSIIKKEAYRSGYTEYYSNKKGYEKIIYSSFDKSKNLLNNSYSLNAVPLSVAKLEKIGITQKLELDLSEIPAVVPEKIKKNGGRLANLFSGNLADLFDDEESPPMESAETQCIQEISKLKI